MMCSPLQVPRPPAQAPGVRILWITNAPPPEATRLLQGTPTPYGGWFAAAAEAMAAQGDVELHIAFPWAATHNVVQGTVARYHPFAPCRLRARDPESAPDFRRFLTRTLAELQPDVVHVWGTELPHALPAVQVAQRMGTPVVTSIQGLVSIYADHYSGNLPGWVAVEPDLVDLRRPTSLPLQRLRFRRSGRAEKRLIATCQNVIGRTTWDRACVAQLNPKVRYFHCDEILREEFWGPHWQPRGMEPYSIFTSQGHVPYKGLHNAIRATAILRKRLPVRLRVAGADPRLTAGPYARYIRRLIQRLELEEVVTFLGPLDADQMAGQLVRANAFVLPSAIENSPNSLAEAMLVGTPCVASYVGGVPDMITHGVEGLLYQADAPYMLAHFLEEVFLHPEAASDLGGRARQRAITRHDPTANTLALLSVYDSVRGPG